MTTRNHPIEAEELMAFLDGELTSDQATAAATHLETCMECQQLAADLRGVSQTLNTWELQPANLTIPKSIAAVFDERVPISNPALAIPMPWYHRPWFRSWAPALAGCVVVATVIVGLLTPHRYAVYQRPASSVARLELRDAQTAAPAASPVTVPTTRSKPEIAADSNGLLGYFADHRADSVSVAGGIGGGVGTGDRDQLDKSAIARKSSVPPAASSNLLPTGPMIIRTAGLSLTTKDFDRGRAHVEEMLKRRRGYVGSLNVTANPGSGRTLTASLRVPSNQLDSTLAELKTLGRLDSESQNGEDITSQYVDLNARLDNARHTEQRLTDVLQNRTGKLSDVLSVENEIARVRGEIESMEAERKSMSNQVDFATVNLSLTEDYRAQLQVVPPSTSTRLSNAAVEGYRNLTDGLMSVALFFLSSGPTLLLWTAVLILPARLLWKRFRRVFAQSS
jgi:hypothetical protein